MSIPNAMEIALREELKSIDQIIDSLNAKRTAILKVLGLYESTVLLDDRELEQPISSDKGPQLNTIDMARVVIRNAGKPLQPPQIKDGIKSTFGVDPAKTLFDMLWKRARQGDKGFYKDGEGNIGLLEMLPKLETVATISSGETMTQ